MSPQEIVIKFVGRGTRQGGEDRWLRQFPGMTPCWGNCRFDFSADSSRYDWLVVYDDLPTQGDERFSSRRELLCCPRQHTLLITTEPSSVKTYGSAYLRQFGHVLSSQEPEWIRHPGHIHSQCGLPWFYGKGSRGMKSLDAMEATPPLTKTETISTVCSSKQQRHTLHHARFLFTTELKTLLPGLEIFGHGIRDMDDKAEALDTFRYHVAVENHVALHHWTEKLADSFLGCALPFYHGCPNVTDYFPPGSFIPIDIKNPAQAARIIQDAVDSGQHEKRLPQILEARKKVLREYNMFAVLTRLVDERHQTSARTVAGDFLLSRRQARRNHPVQSAVDFSRRTVPHLKGWLRRWRTK